MALESKQIKSLFISHALPVEAAAQTEYKAWLKRLSSDLKVGKTSMCISHWHNGIFVAYKESQYVTQRNTRNNEAIWPHPYFPL